MSTVTQTPTDYQQEDQATITVRIPRALKVLLERKANEEDSDLSKLIRRAVKKDLSVGILSPQPTRPGRR